MTWASGLAKARCIPARLQTLPGREHHRRRTRSHVAGELTEPRKAPGRGDRPGTSFVAGTEDVAVRCQKLRGRVLRVGGRCTESRRKVPVLVRTSGKSSPPVPPWMYTSPLGKSRGRGVPAFRNILPVRTRLSSSRIEEIGIVVGLQRRPTGRTGSRRRRPTSRCCRRAAGAGRCRRCRPRWRIGQSGVRVVPRPNSGSQTS